VTPGGGAHDGSPRGTGDVTRPQTPAGAGSTGTPARHDAGGLWEHPLGAAKDVWAVFVQGRRRDTHVYAGDVHAPDAEMALVLAKENYTRRDPCVSLWVVRADQIHATAQDAAEMFVPATDKSYRFGGSYRQQRRVLQSSYQAAYREEDQ